MTDTYLGIDTSNYTTSLALCGGGKIIKSVRRLLPVKQGECGLRQSDAVFLHIKALPELSEELFSSELFVPGSLRGVGVSVSPRDAAGSYMPCFLAGVSFAAAAANSCRVPIYNFSHQAGHIMAGIYSSGRSELAESGFLCYHVSGGTTEALYVKSAGDSFSCEICGGTTDASAGQIIDRAGVYAGLEFPAGKHLEKLALESSDKKIGLCVSEKDGYFSMSGLQNKFEKYMQSGLSINDAARFVFESIAVALSRSLVSLRNKYGKNVPALFVGGVCSNSIIREILLKNESVYFASPELSSDNACGTALLCERAVKNAPSLR